MLHLKDIVIEGNSKVLIHTVDTNVAVLAIKALEFHHWTEGWFGAGQSFRLIAANEIANALGPQWCMALCMFHAFTRVDTVSYFWGEREQTACKLWMTFNDVTEAFCDSKIQDILMSFCAYNYTADKPSSINE